jgi:hypothetical protein
LIVFFTLEAVLPRFFILLLLVLILFLVFGVGGGVFFVFNWYFGCFSVVLGVCV